MKPFDLEAAKRGEPIVRYYESGGNPDPVSFVGMLSTGVVVVERKDRDAYKYWPSELHMAPVPVTIYVVTWWFEGGIDESSNFWFPEKEQAEGYAEAVKSKYGQPGNKWNHPVITPVEVSE